MSKYEKLDPKIINRIIRRWKMSAGIGSDWYFKVNKLIGDMAEKDYATKEQIIAVVCALSPGLSWDRNLFNALAFCNSFALGLRGEELIEATKFCSTYGALALRKCEAILLGEDPLEVLSGPKVLAFYDNMVDPENSTVVTVDRHARMIALGLERTDANGNVKSLGEYVWLSKHYAAAAKKLGVRPHELQAATWAHFRENEIQARFKK